MAVDTDGADTGGQLNKIVGDQSLTGDAGLKAGCIVLPFSHQCN